MKRTKQELRIIRVIEDIIKDGFIRKAERILQFVEQVGYKLPSEGKK